MRATVTASSGLPMPTGNVQFTNGSKVLGTATLSNGTATLNTTFAAAGSVNLKATYQGAGNYMGSSATAVQTVQ